jgi:two-component system chemotaxis response regulator CheB
MTRPIRVLVVDDSALVRNILRRGLSSCSDIEVVGTAADPYEARDILVRERPDVMTLDVEMPKMDGLTFLRKVMAYMPTRIIVLSSLSGRGTAIAAQALELGAIDVVAKPSSDVARSLPDMMAELVARIRAAANARLVSRPDPALTRRDSVTEGPSSEVVIGLGASTGGVNALGRILPTFPANSPAIVVVQHMPSGFTHGFAERLAGECVMQVSEAEHGAPLRRGHVLIAPGGTRHLTVERVAGELRVALHESGGGLTPSVDVFFASLARIVGKNACACLLTGMGKDGAPGLLALRHAGARTFVQDEASSAVWGMPGAAVELGAAEAQVPLGEIPSTLLRAIAERTA